MGRRKMELKRIEDKSSRQVSFSKRRKGLMKKAREISILCDAQLALLVFSSHGKLYDFSSHHSSLTKILKRYRNRTEAGSSKGATNVEGSNDEDAGISPTTLLQIVQRYVVDRDPADDQQLTVDELVQLEYQLDMALTHIRARKTQLELETLKTLQEKELELKRENEVLKEQIAAAVDGGGGDDDDDNNTAIGTFRGSDSYSGGPPTLRLLQ